MRWKDLGFKEGVIVGAALAALLFVGSWLWSERTDVDLLAAMTAFGTVGAVIVALISTAISRSDLGKHIRHSQEVLSWVLRPELRALSGRILNARTLLKEIKSVRDGDSIPKITLSTIGWVAKDIQVPFCAGSLDRLAALPPRCGFAVAAVVGEAPRLQAALLWFSTVDRLPMDQEMRNMIAGYASHCDKIDGLLEDTGYVLPR